MGELKLYGMKAAFDEIMATAVKRQHEPQRIIGDLLNAEISEKQARSIKYQLTIAKLPLAKDLDDFQFEGTPINGTLVNDLAGGGFIAQQRNAVLVGGTGTGKTHLSIAIARSCIRGGSRGRFYNVVDLVNRLETETRIGRQGRLADHLTRMDFIVLDELGYLPFAQSGGDHPPSLVAPKADPPWTPLGYKSSIPGGDVPRVGKKLHPPRDPPSKAGPPPGFGYPVITLRPIEGHAALPLCSRRRTWPRTGSHRPYHLWPPGSAYPYPLSPPRERGSAANWEELLELP